MPYVDPRAYEDRLNALVPGNWHVEFQPWGEHRIICRLTIHHVTRSSTGESGDSPENIQGTSMEAQAFKRACSRFGLGRYLYSIAPLWVTFDPTTRRIEQPHAPSSLSRGLPSCQEPQPTSGGAPNSRTIGSERAVAMHRELTKVGLRRSQQRAYAAQVLGREVLDLAELTEPEARVVWTKASAA